MLVSKTVLSPEPSPPPVPAPRAAWTQLSPAPIPVPLVRVAGVQQVPAAIPFHRMRPSPSQHPCQFLRWGQLLSSMFLHLFLSIGKEFPEVCTPPPGPAPLEPEVCAPSVSIASGLLNCSVSTAGHAVSPITCTVSAPDPTGSLQNCANCAAGYGVICQDFLCFWTRLLPVFGFGLVPSVVTSSNCLGQVGLFFLV